jgi:lipopolysaccharide assembly outer membrane protein LptD (OstA)
MKGPQGQSNYFDSPIMGIGMQSGQTQVMQPGEEYFFPQDEAVYERKMQEGGLSLDNISPSGDFNYSSRASAGPLGFRMSTGTNVVTKKQQELFPEVSLDLDNFNMSYDPKSLTVGARGNKGYINAFRDLESKNTNINAGLNLDKFNLDANAFLEKDKLANIGASAQYRVNPNLSFTGDVNYAPGQGSPNYNVGFRYSKTFQGGGMSIPGVQGTVVAAPTTLKEAYRKKKKK